MTHQVPPFDIEGGALLLGVHALVAPSGTIFVAVVDPDVGTGRKAVIVQAETGKGPLRRQYTFVGPNNGVLSEALRRLRITAVREIKNRDLWRKPTSATFHGRDIFAPVAGNLVEGLSLHHFGPALKVQDLAPNVLSTEVNEAKTRMVGKVAYVDAFGNLVTTVRKAEFQNFVGKRPFTISMAPDRLVLLNGGDLTKIVRTFDDVPEGEVGALFGGDFPPFMTVAVNMGNAQKMTGAKKGDEVVVKIVKA